MENTDSLLLAGLIFLAAALYSSVGHGGASGYLAAMALFGVAPAEMKPMALVLNVFVASIATFRFYRVGGFSWPLFWPLALVSIPMAFLGGALTVPGHIYKPIVGVVLLFAAWWVYASARGLSAPGLAHEAAIEERIAGVPQRGWLLLAGATIGFLSGLVGVGGGIFLSPLLLLFAWASTRQVAGISAAFILVNSMAGLAGWLTTSPPWPDGLPLLVVAAVIGGLIGSGIGARRLGSDWLRRLLAVVLVIAGVKMILA